VAEFRANFVCAAWCRLPAHFRIGKCSEVQHAGTQKGDAKRAVRRKENALTGPTHPSLMIMLGATRRAEVHADVGRYRLMHGAQPEASLRQHWADLAALAIVVLMAVWLATGFAAPNGLAGPARSSVDAGDPPFVTQVEARRLLDPMAVRQIDGAQL
jgi:hypothetical protein